MDNHIIDQNRVRQIFFLLLVVLLGLLLFIEMFGFLSAFLGSITLYIVMRKAMFYLTTVRKWKKGWTTIFLMLISMVVILLPIGVLINMLSTKIAYALQHSNDVVNALKTVVANLEQKFDIGIASEENISKLSNVLAENLPKVLGATLSTLGSIIFMYFILYFMLMNGREMEHSLYEHTPLKDDNVHKLGSEVQNMVLSNAIGIPVIALMQGIVGIIGYYIIGVEQPWFWFVVTCITAMLPVVGAALAYVPLAIIFFAGGQNMQGVFMLIYGFGVIGTIDNVFRLTLARKIGNVHPLITIFGVIIGLDLFGFLGLIFGPLLISLFILLLKIYSNEFITKQRHLHSKHLEN